MKIAKVRIQNFRSIRDLTFEPTTLCALIGGNNTGKSNILKALNLILGERWPGVRSISDADFYGGVTGEDMEIAVWFDEEREVRGDVGDPVSFSGIKFRVTQYQRKTARNQKGDLRTEFVCIGDDGEPVMVLKRSRSGGRPHPESANVTGAVREMLPAVFIDVDRSASYHLSGSQWSILGRLLRDVSNKLKADKKRYELFREKFDEARAVLRTDDFVTLERTVISQLQAHTGLSGVELILDDLDPLNLYKSFAVLFKDDQTPTPVNAERMGSGVQSAVVISLLQAYRTLRKEQAVLLFEEPELFLHPHGRRHLFRLLSDLADSGTQVIYTTHSQDLVDLTRMDCVHLVDNTPDIGTLASPPTKGALSDDWRARLKIAKHFGSPRNEIFFADFVVLVEGVTEQAAIRILGDMMPIPIDLDRRNCSVIEVGGKESLPLMIRIVKALKKPVLAVHDTDSKKKSSEAIANNARLNRAIADEISGDGTALFLMDPDFEAVAGIDGGKRDKDYRARDFLAGLKSWDEVPERLRELMATIEQTFPAAVVVDDEPTEERSPSADG